MYVSGVLTSDSQPGEELMELSLDATAIALMSVQGIRCNMMYLFRHENWVTAKKLLGTTGYTVCMQHSGDVVSNNNHDELDSSLVIQDWPKSVQPTGKATPLEIAIVVVFLIGWNWSLLLLLATWNRLWLLSKAVIIYFWPKGQSDREKSSFAKSKRYYLSQIKNTCWLHRH